MSAITRIRYNDPQCDSFVSYPLSRYGVLEFQALKVVLVSLCSRYEEKGEILKCWIIIEYDCFKSIYETCKALSIISNLTEP